MSKCVLVCVRYPGVQCQCQTSFLPSSAPQLCDPTCPMPRPADSSPLLLPGQSGGEPYYHRCIQCHELISLSSIITASLVGHVLGLVADHLFADKLLVTD